MSHVAWSVCMCVLACVGHTGELYRTAESTKMPFEGQTRVRSRNLVSDGSGNLPTGRNTLDGNVCHPLYGKAKAGVRRRCGHLPIDFGHLFIYCTE